MPSDRIPLIINVVIPLLMIVLSVPLVYEKIPPNRWYGFRTPKTFSSDSMWYRTNKLGGQYFIVAALVQLVALIVLALTWPGAAAQVTQWGILPAAPLLVAVLLWFLRMRKF